VSQQLPEREFLVEVFGVPKIRSLSAGDVPPWATPARFLLGAWVLPRILLYAPPLTMRRLLLLRRHGLRRHRRRHRSRAFAVAIGAAGVVAAGAADFGGGETDAHDGRMTERSEEE